MVWDCALMRMHPCIFDGLCIPRTLLASAQRQLYGCMAHCADVLEDVLFVEYALIQYVWNVLCSAILVLRVKSVYMGTCLCMWCVYICVCGVCVCVCVCVCVLCCACVVSMHVCVYACTCMHVLHVSGCMSVSCIQYQL